MKTPEPHKVSIAATVLGIIVLLGSVGSAITVWNKLLPYITDIELAATQRQLHKEILENAKFDEELRRLVTEEKRERCENTIHKVETNLWRAQQNEFEANQQEPVNRIFVRAAQQAQIGFRAALAEAKRKCGHR